MSAMDNQRDHQGVHQSDQRLPDAERKSAFVRQGFNRIAVRYDLLNDIMTGGLHRLWKREVVRRLHLGQGMRILDLCSGTGDLAARAAGDSDASTHVVALDFSAGMMNAGRKRMQANPQAFIEKVSWVCGDATVIPFVDASFDGAMVGFGLRNVSSLDFTLREVHRVLKPGSFFVSLDTAGTEWRIFRAPYRFYMNRIVPRLGALLAGSGDMYSYLSSSAEAFAPPEELKNHFEKNGFIETGFVFCPRGLGGAAIVWGKRPE